MSKLKIVLTGTGVVGLSLLRVMRNKYRRAAIRKDDFIDVKKELDEELNVLFHVCGAFITNCDPLLQLSERVAFLQMALYRCHDLCLYNHFETLISVTCAMRDKVKWQICDESDILLFNRITDRLYAFSRPDRTTDYESYDNVVQLKPPA